MFWIGIKLVLPEDEDAHGNVQGSTTLTGAIKTIIVADAVMSLDNVIAVAAAAHGSIVLVIFGIVVSIPIVVWGSKLVLTLMDRFPVVITAGGGLLGWIGGGMLVTDPAFANPDKWMWVPKLPQTDTLRYAASIAGALLVLVVGKWMASRRPPAAASAEHG